MALCIMDENEKISNMAKLFFTELSRKGNKLYNVMPDIVSRLSDPNAEISEAKFKEIMRYIISLIDKDKHSESLVEKLCHRFHATTTQRQWRDIGFCLSIFNFNDKAAKKLVDNFSCFADKLHEDVLYEAVLSILTQCKKLAKTETKLAIEEMGNKVEEAREKCVEDHGAGNRAKEAKIGGKNSKKATRKSKEESSDSEEMEQEIQPNLKAKKKQPLRKSRASFAKSEENSSESEDDFKAQKMAESESEEEVKAQKKVKKGQKIIEESESEIDEEKPQTKDKKGRKLVQSDSEKEEKTEDEKPQKKTKKGRKVVEESEEEENTEDEKPQKNTKKGRKIIEESEEDEEEKAEVISNFYIMLNPFHVLLFVFYRKNKRRDPLGDPLWKKTTQKMNRKYLRKEMSMMTTTKKIQTKVAKSLRRDNVIRLHRMKSPMRIPMNPM